MLSLRFDVKSESLVFSYCASNHRATGFCVIVVFSAFALLFEELVRPLSVSPVGVVSVSSV